MKFDLKRPCDNCPFLRVGGVRLLPDRVREIAEGMLDSQGTTFACHKTTVDGEDEEGNGDRVVTPESKHCAGALIFAEKNRTATQAMRIMERLRMYDAAALMKDEVMTSKVFDDVDEMVRVNRRELHGGKRR